MPQKTRKAFFCGLPGLGRLFKKRSSKTKRIARSPLTTSPSYEKTTIRKESPRKTPVKRNHESCNDLSFASVSEEGSPAKKIHFEREDPNPGDQISTSPPVAERSDSKGVLSPKLNQEAVENIENIEPKVMLSFSCDNLGCLEISGCQEICLEESAMEQGFFRESFVEESVANAIEEEVVVEFNPAPVAMEVEETRPTSLGELEAASAVTKHKSPIRSPQEPSTLIPSRTIEPEPSIVEETKELPVLNEVNTTVTDNENCVSKTEEKSEPSIAPVPIISRKEPDFQTPLKTDPVFKQPIPPKSSRKTPNPLKYMLRSKSVSTPNKQKHIECKPVSKLVMNTPNPNRQRPESILDGHSYRWVQFQSVLGALECIHSSCKSRFLTACDEHELRYGKSSVVRIECNICKKDVFVQTLLNETPQKAHKLRSKSISTPCKKKQEESNRGRVGTVSVASHQQIGISALDCSVYKWVELRSVVNAIESLHFCKNGFTMACNEKALQHGKISLIQIKCSICKENVAIQTYGEDTR
ncbi:uncharacterized protein LOC116613523 [Nematostella vectensis]|uniref:uncharacterized protein LOC116613523 n=1 Tax=Nematostella vectensis TaxID=45351 RepID=UPI002077469B|nr:uncharacterized protein LOC116613523 [Nematostella vectensis]